MRKLLSIAIVVLAVGGVFAASPGAALFRPQPPQTPPDEEPAGEKSEPEKKLIDLKADLMGPVAPGDSAIFLVGDFAAQHNGAVITADSAVRYSADRIEFFGHVLINQNTTYIYGDRAEYDGSINEARVYSDIVKVVDGDATLYTYNFVFNTKDNVGTFTGGGVMYNRDNLMEALRGYYFSNTKELVCADSVQMRNDEYRMKGDSVIYDLDTDHAFFFARTNIWNRDGDYIYTDRGSYSKADSLYSLTLNGYILTAKQEVWSDSLDYWRGEEHAVLRRNIQIDDSERKTLAFGDYGEYWKEPGNALLTLRPSLVNYDPQQPDSLFARADTIWLYTIFPQRDAWRPLHGPTRSPRVRCRGIRSPRPECRRTSRPPRPGPIRRGAAAARGRTQHPAGPLRTACAPPPCAAIRLPGVRPIPRRSLRGPQTVCCAIRCRGIRRCAIRCPNRRPPSARRNCGRRRPKPRPSARRRPPVCVPPVWIRSPCAGRRRRQRSCWLRRSAKRRVWPPAGRRPSSGFTAGSRRRFCAAGSYRTPRCSSGSTRSSTGMPP